MVYVQFDFACINDESIVRWKCRCGRVHTTTMSYTKYRRLKKAFLNAEQVMFVCHSIPEHRIPKLKGEGILYRIDPHASSSGGIGDKLCKRFKVSQTNLVSMGNDIKKVEKNISALKKQSKKLDDTRLELNEEVHDKIRDVHNLTEKLSLLQKTEDGLYDLTSKKG